MTGFPHPNVNGFVCFGLHERGFIHRIPSPYCCF